MVKVRPHVNEKSPDLHFESQKSGQNKLFSANVRRFWSFPSYSVAA